MFHQCCPSLCSIIVFLVVPHCVPSLCSLIVFSHSVPHCSLTVFHHNVLSVFSHCIHSLCLLIVFHHSAPLLFSLIILSHCVPSLCSVSVFPHCVLSLCSIILFPHVSPRQLGSAHLSRVVWYELTVIASLGCPSLKILDFHSLVYVAIFAFFLLSSLLILCGL